ncbi:MAG: hypothetical protein HOP17_08435 [Acidobacteria bacterium]|nr:hypothetical protein [Acidobacteriota bacterium]
MVDTGKRVPPWHLSLNGKLVGPSDIWGNRFPPPECWVEFHTTDQSYILMARSSMFAGAITDPGGIFNLTSPQHPRIIPSNSYYLLITNNTTKQTHRHPINAIEYNRMVHVAGGSHLNFDELQVPWTAVVPVIARINGRDMKYPVDVARGLIQQFKAYNAATTVDLVRSSAGQPDPDPDLDALLAAIEAEGNGAGPPDKCLKFLREITPKLRINLMSIRKPVDAVTLGLEKCSNNRYNTQNIRDFASMRLDAAVTKAFGITSPFFLELKGRAGFSVVLFAAGCVANGKKIRVTTADTISEHVTSVWV